MRAFCRQREQETALESIDLNALVHEVVDLTRARWSAMPQERGIVIDLNMNLAAGLPKLRGAEQEIRDALTNLIFNAVDAMPEGGTLTIRTWSTEDGASSSTRGRSVMLQVADTGIGMKPETRARCLEPFFTTKGERGTGLGLAMVYGMVQRHDAELEITSEIGQGTTIRIQFPALGFVVPAAKESVVIAAPTAPLRILIVDDDPLVIESLQAALQADRHVVTPAANGQAGIDAFVAAHANGATFDVVISDLGMPYVDGRQVAAAVKMHSPFIPVILLTGWGNQMLSDGEAPQHVDRVLSKPPKLRELRAALAEVAHKR